MSAQDGDVVKGGLMRTDDGNLQLYVPGTYVTPAQAPANSLGAAAVVPNPSSVYHAYDGTSARGSSNQTYSMTHLPPHLGQHLAHQGYYPSSTTTHYGAQGGSAQAGSLIVACPACRQHLMPPPGARIFACPCGQRMAAPQHAPQQPSAMMYASSTTATGSGGFGMPQGASAGSAAAAASDDPFEVIKPSRSVASAPLSSSGGATGVGASTSPYAPYSPVSAPTHAYATAGYGTAGTATGQAAAGHSAYPPRIGDVSPVSPGADPPGHFHGHAQSPYGTVAGHGGPSARDGGVGGMGGNSRGPPGDAVRHVRCPGCHSLLATTTDITVCGVCGLHMSSGPPAPAGPPVGLGPRPGPQGHTHTYAGQGGFPPAGYGAASNMLDFQASRPARSGWDVFWKGL